jgi:hypothetical protein
MAGATGATGECVTPACQFDNRRAPSLVATERAPDREFPLPTGAQQDRAEEVKPNTRLPLLTRPKIWCDCVPK